jgi:4-amino-4-deoxy-L-arabinose transferase-like glycosyltransferase
MDSSIKRYISFSLVLIGASFLRFYHLGQRGLILFDEAHYLFEARWVILLLSKIPGLHGWCEWALGDGNILVTSGKVAKPGFGLILALFSLIVGLRDYTGLLFSGIMSIVIIFLVYLFGRRSFGKKAAFYSSFFLAIMPYFLHYSRSGLPEIGFLLFFYTGIFLYFGSIREDGLNWRVPLSGLLIGYGITCSYKWFMILPLFLGFEILFWLRNRFSIRRIFLFFLSLLLPPFAFEAIYSLLFISGLIPSSTPTYLDQLLTHKGIVPLSRLFDLEDIHISGYYLLRLIGPIGLMFLGMGMIHLFKKRSSEGIILSSLVLFIAFLFGVMNPIRVPRALSGALPGIALLMGNGVVSLYDRWAKKGFWSRLPSLFLILHLLYNGWVDLGILSLRSGYKEAASYMIEEKQLRHITTSNISVFYLGPPFYYSSWFSPDLEKAFREMEDLYKRGYRLFLVDWMDEYWRVCFRRRSPTLCQLIRKRHSPVKSFENNAQRHWFFLYESGLKSENVMRFSQDKEIDKILIYKIEDILKEGP